MKLLAPHSSFGLTATDCPPNCWNEIIGSRVLVRESDGTWVKGTIDAYYWDHIYRFQLFGLTRDIQLPGGDGRPYSASDYYEPDWRWYERDEFIVLNYAGIDLLAAYILQLQEAV